MATFDPIDSWFESGFRIRRQRVVKGADGGKKGRSRDSSRRVGSASPPKRGGVNLSSNAKKENIKSSIQKAPQVMVKITGSSYGMADMKRHLDYISRNGKEELTNELGEVITGKDGLKGLKKELEASQIPEESKKRESIHVLFSMPKGTPEKEFKESVAEFVQEEFSNRQYVMAFHDNTDHLHIHVNVGTRDIDRADEPRLNPRKHDLFRWRQGFADKLRSNGIEATASYRTSRFNYRKAEHAVVRQIRADNPKSPAFNAKRAKEKGVVKNPRVPDVYQKLSEEIKQALETNTRPENPAKENIENNRKALLKAWSSVADNLESEGETSLAMSVRSLISEGDKTVVSRNQELFDEATRNQSIVDRTEPELDI